jgi:hypothetical protein
MSIQKSHRPSSCRTRRALPSPTFCMLSCHVSAMYDSSVCFLPSAREVAWLTAENSGPGGTLHLRLERPAPSQPPPPRERPWPAHRGGCSWMGGGRPENRHGRHIGMEVLGWSSCRRRQNHLGRRVRLELSDGAPATYDPDVSILGRRWEGRRFVSRWVARSLFPINPDWGWLFFFCICPLLFIADERMDGGGIEGLFSLILLCIHRILRSSIQHHRLLGPMFEFRSWILRRPSCWSVHMVATSSVDAVVKLQWEVSIKDAFTISPASLELPAVR